MYLDNCAAHFREILSRFLRRDTRHRLFRSLARVIVTRTRREASGIRRAYRYRSTYAGGSKTLRRVIDAHRRLPRARSRGQLYPTRGVDEVPMVLPRNTRNSLK